MSGNPKLILKQISEEQQIDELTGSPVAGEQLLTVETNPVSLANSSSDPTLSIEEELTGFPGTRVTVPIFISDANDLASVTLEIDYDTEVFDVVDPVQNTATNEAVRKTGISEDWILSDSNNPNTELANPVANVDETNGKITISLLNPTQVSPTGSGNILEIDFTVAADAPTDSTTTIDLRSARLGFDNTDDETVLGDSLLGDGTVTVAAGGIDIDANGVADALTDGVLLVRDLFGFSGNALINGAVAGNATRTTAAEIQTYISQIESTIDIDGNGVADALTDGVLIVRHLFGFSGNALINGALAGNATNTNAEEIASAIDNLIP
jgi:hypothetical protein